MKNDPDTATHVARCWWERQFTKPTIKMVYGVQQRKPFKIWSTKSGI